MSHRVSQKIFRIGNITKWNSRWLQKKKTPQYLEEDFRIREFLKRRLKDSGLEKIEIERFPGKVNIVIQTSRPGLVIGRGGEGIEQLKKELVKEIFGKRILSDKRIAQTEKKEIKLEIQEIKNPWVSVNLVGQWVARRLERRMPFKRVLKQAIDKVIENKEVLGVRIEIAGRLGGSEHARTQWLKKGQMPRQTLRADIDYAQVEAYCSYGVIGVKVWIYKGERFAK